MLNLAPKDIHARSSHGLQITRITGITSGVQTAPPSIKIAQRKKTL